MDTLERAVDTQSVRRGPDYYRIATFAALFIYF